MCAVLSLRRILLRSEGQVQVFQGLDPAPAFSAHAAVKPRSVSAFHGRTCAAELLSTPSLPTCPAELVL